MENTNQKNTGNIQIAPVSAASDLNHKREGYLTWDEYFMGVAMLSGMRSKDPNSQVGACIVSDDNKILSMGYNGFPKGGSLEGAKMYVTLFPCNECAKAIIQAGIKTLVYDCDKYASTPSVLASKRMLDSAGVRYYQYKRTGREISLTV